MRRTRVVFWFQACKGEKNQRDEICYLWKTQRVGREKGFAWLPNLQIELHSSMEGTYMYSICDNTQSFRVKESCCLKTNFFLVTFSSMCQPWVSFISRGGGKSYNANWIKLNIQFKVFLFADLKYRGCRAEEFRWAREHWPDWLLWDSRRRTRVTSLGKESVTLHFLPLNFHVYPIIMFTVQEDGFSRRT